VQTTCLSAIDLLAAALRDPQRPTALARHLLECDACREEVRGLRGGAHAVHLSDVPHRSLPQPCLSDADIARLVEGEPVALEEAAAHVLSCPDCRTRLATVSALLRDEAIRAEVDRLDRTTTVTRRLVAAGTLGAALAAAVVAAVFMAPERDAAAGASSTIQGATHRERAITTTLAPRLLPPPAGEAGVIRWTSVPYADRYELRVFDRSGALVWSESTADTSAAVPPRLEAAPRATYLGKVDARTGWDRWVSSDWAEMTIGGENAR